MARTVIVPPVSEPLTLADAKAHLRVLHDAEDAVIGGCIAAARAAAEAMTGRAIIRQTLRHDTAGFPAVRWLRLAAPVDEVLSVTYVPAAGGDQVPWVPYAVDHAAGLLGPLAGDRWPAAACQPGSVSVTYRAGWLDAASVPSDIRAALLMLTAHLYVQREPVNVGNIVNALPFGVEAMLTPWKLWGFA